MITYAEKENQPVQLRYHYTPDGSGVNIFLVIGEGKYLVCYFNEDGRLRLYTLHPTVQEILKNAGFKITDSKIETS